MNFDKQEATVFPAIDKDNWNGHCYVSAPSGAGKSTFIGTVLREFRTVFKGCQVFVFSLLRDDPAFKKLDPIYIDINEDIIDKPLTLEEFRGTAKQPSILVFDDVEINQNRHLASAIQTFMDLAVECRRH